MSSLSAIQKMIIEEFELTSDQVGPEALLESLGIDSLETIEFIWKLEKHFSIDFPDQTKKIETVGDISREVDLLLAKK